jgi:hypothetical protein
MTKKVSPSTEHYIVPARLLTGTRDEVLAQIDELILGLTGLRQLVSLHGPTPAEAPRRKLHVVKGFLKVILLIGIALWASPAQGQTGASGSTPPAAQDQDAAPDVEAGRRFGGRVDLQ